jgi:hypothetical protein
MGGRGYLPTNSCSSLCCGASSVKHEPDNNLSKEYDHQTDNSVENSILCTRHVASITCGGDVFEAAYDDEYN